MIRLARHTASLLLVALVASACGGDPEPSPVPVNAQGFPIDWPVAVPPGNVNDCDNGTVSQEDVFFSVVMCLPDEPDPFTASEQYLATPVSPNANPARSSPAKKPSLTATALRSTSS